jgi:hypothetical protein
VLALVVVQLWFWSQLFVGDVYLARSDLYEYFLPTFLSPRTIWSVYELAGFPAFADPQQTAWYPLHALSRAVGSWSLYVVSAYVVASLGAYAYVRSITRSTWAAIAAGVTWPWCEALAEKYPHLSTLHAYAWLPVLLVCLERLAAMPGVRWMVASSGVIAAIVLAGHPQATVYVLYLCAAYGLVLGWAERRTRSFFFFLVASFVCGMLLAAILVVPLQEIGDEAARVNVSFSQFAESFARHPRELAIMVVPQIVHDGREAPLYIGLLTLMAVMLAWRWPGSRWRLGFWIVAAVLCLLLGLGSSTPVAGLAYYVPLYDRFRIVARHLVLFSFAMIVLSGFGVAALMAGAWRTRWILAPAITALAAGGGIMIAVAANDSLPIAEGALLSIDDDPRSALAGQAAIGLVSLILVLVVARFRSRLAMALLLGVLAVDLLNRYPVNAFGLEPGGVLPTALADPSVHTQWLKQLTDASSQRLLPLAGSSRDAIAMGVFSRTWKIASAGGYGPLLLQRFARLTQMEANGSIDRTSLFPANRALDILAVRYLIVPEAEIETGSTSEHVGMQWAEPELELPLGRPDCGSAIPGFLALGLAAGTRVRTVAIVSHLRCSENVPEGTPVATVTIASRGGERISQTLRAGSDVSDAYFGVTGVTERMKHRQAVVFARRGEGGAAGYTATYLTQLDLGREIEASHLEFVTPPMHGWWVLNRATILDGSATSTPIRLPNASLDMPGRWRELRRIRTSRQTDRGEDRDGPGEDGFVVYENLQALPRAWMVSEVISLSDVDGVAALQTSRRPDGSMFDPAVTAFIDSSGEGRTSPAGNNLVRMTSVGDGILRMRVATDHGGLLVVSENWYPGWTADIDGTPADVVRTNYTLMGVTVPPGVHYVTLRFRPASLALGAVVSAATALVLTVAWLLTWRKSRRSSVGAS